MNAPDALDDLLDSVPAKSASSSVLTVRNSGRDVIGEVNKATTAETFAGWLAAEGWAIRSRSGDRITLARPGGDGTESANIQTAGDGTPLLYNFSTNAGLPVDTALSPFLFKCFKRYGNTDKATMAQFAADVRGDKPKTATTGATTAEADNPTGPRFKFIDSKEFSAGDYRAEWLIQGVLTKGEPWGVIGLSKTLKTTIAIDALISMATATPFLGTFPVPRPYNVALMSAESGMRTLQETARRVCKAKGFEFVDIPRGRLSWCFDVPTLTDVPALADLGTALVDRGVEVVCVDPFYMTLGAVDARNLFDVGEVLANVGRLLSDRGLSVGFLHHANRKAAPGRDRKHEPLELTDIAYSGLEQWLRQWVLISRREKYEHDGRHKLHFAHGGSAGHQGLHELDIYEGVTDEHFNGRVWDVSVTPSAEAKEKAA